MTVILKHPGLNNSDFAWTFVSVACAMSGSVIVLFGNAAALPSEDAFEAVLGGHGHVEMSRFVSIWPL